MDRPLPWLRYIDADAVQAPELFFDGMKVRNDAMETLGSVDGFIVDNTSMRPYYVVVDSGGWFKSKHFLVPIGHAHIDDDRDAVVVDIAKQRIEAFPGFDLDNFEKLDTNDIRRMNDQIVDSSRDRSVVYQAADPLSPLWGAPEFTQPDWWARSVTGFAGADVPVSDAYIAIEEYPATTVGQATGELQAEQMIGREGGAETTRSRQARAQGDHDAVANPGPEPSPYVDGRAQPGDVLGVETGGEQTHIGETTEDENRRRLDAERDRSKQRD